ncbi:MAG TPA: META domain-containing protein [Allosphingosinicella sp.]
MRGAGLFLLLPLAAACASPQLPAPEPPAPVPAAAPAPVTEAPELSDAALFGRWEIVAVNGAAPRPSAGQRGGERTPFLVFGAGSYGGSTGCNSFGGLGVLAGGRFYASGASQTAIGCGDLTAQEDAIIGILTGSPSVSAAADGRLTLGSARGTILLRRAADGAPARPAEEEGPALLAGTRWTIASVDGRRLPESARRSLAFEAESWSLAGPCGATGGAWRQQGDRIDARPEPAEARACGPDAAALDAALAATLAARPRFATGANGEILIGGGGHWATGERPRAALLDEAPLLAGTWRIVAIDGAAPAAGSAPQIAFGPSGHSGSAGCNAFQSYHLAHARRLFAPPPVATERGCGPLAAQEARVLSLLAGAPRIARGGDGEIALVDARGGLRLRREAAAAAWAPAGRLWTGTPLQAELTMLDGVPLQAHNSQPAARLRLSAQRFDIASGCGRIGGIWRRPREPGGPGEIELLTDAEPPPAGACAGVLAGRLDALMRLLNGRARILIGASGELVVAGERHWLIGRVTPPARPRR